MKQRALLALILGLTLLGAACGDAHMGDGYGRRTRSALDAQQAKGGEGSMPIDGDDARMVMQQHRSAGTATGGGQAGASGTSGSSYGGASSSNTVVTPTPMTPIRLDAK